MSRMPAAMGETGRYLRAFGLRQNARTSSRQAGLVVVYHRVGDMARHPHLAIDPGVARGAFVEQLAHLRRCYRVVRAAEILEAAAERRHGQRFPVAITFDDDLSSHVREALPALRRAGLPATFFLCGSSLSAPHSFWWEDLQRAIDHRLVAPDGLPGVPDDLVRAALDRAPAAIRGVASAIERLEAARRDEVTDALREAVRPAPADSGLRGDDVRALAEAGFEVGFHTLRHEALPALPDVELQRALHEGRDALAVAAGRPLELIAYPHGKADGRVAQAARGAGFTLAFTTVPGLVSRDSDRHLLPRIVPATSVGAFALQLARAFTERT